MPYGQLRGDWIIRNPTATRFCVDLGLNRGLRPVATGGNRWARRMLGCRDGRATEVR
jgi:hypothetical protein